MTALNSRFERLPRDRIYHAVKWCGCFFIIGAIFSWLN
jgi:hypothetical protein